MKTLRLFTLFLGMFAMGQSGLGADVKVDPNLKAGQAALRSKEYKLAVVALDKVVVAKGDRVDEATYLKALPQYYGKQHDACIVTCNKLAGDHKDSAWNHKGRFLKANAFVQKRNYESD